jgi:hypothetical protein
MENEKEIEGLDELDFDISKVEINPTGVNPKTELDPEPEPAPEPQPEPKRGRPKKVEIGRAHV